MVKVNIQHASQGVGASFVIHHGSIFTEQLHAAGLHGTLQLGNGVRIVHMVFLITAAAQAMVAGGVQGGVCFQVQGVKGTAVAEDHVFVDFLQPNAAYPGNGVGEVPVNHILPDADGLEDLCALVGLKHRDAHFGGNPADTVGHGGNIVLLGIVLVFVQQTLFDHLVHALQRQVGVHCPGTVAQQQGKVVHISRICRFQNHADGRPAAGADQMLFQGGNSQQGGDGHVVFIHPTVGQDQHIGAVLVGTVTDYEKMVQGVLQGFAAVVEHGYAGHTQGFFRGVLNPLQISVGKNRLLQAQHGTVLRLILQQVAVTAHVHCRIRYNLFTDGVNGGIGHLGKELPEVLKQGLMLVGKHCQRDVCTHGGGRFCPGACHGQDDFLHLFVGVAKGLVQPITGILRQLGCSVAGQGKILQGQ